MGRFFGVVILVFTVVVNVPAQRILYVRAGNAGSPDQAIVKKRMEAVGSLENPFTNIQQAINAASEILGSHRDSLAHLGTEEGTDHVVIYLRGGTYYLDSPLIINSKRFGDRHSKTGIDKRAGHFHDKGTLGNTDADADFPGYRLLIQSYPGEKVIISGGQPLRLDWQPYKKGIYVAKVPGGSHFETLFVNQRQQVLARYPNYNPASLLPLQGTAADAVDPDRVKGWDAKMLVDGGGAYLHGLHAAAWGSLHYKITEVHPDGSLRRTGGWQNNRPSSLSPSIRYVENVMEELDTAKEWFLDRSRDLLYYMPAKDMTLAALQQASFVGAGIKNCLVIKGDAVRPMAGVWIRGIDFTGTGRSFMETREPLLRSDWRIYRGGAVLFEGTRDCRIEDCNFYALGGNAVMISGYNRKAVVRGNHIYQIGASGICFIGKESAVRSPLDNYAGYIPFDSLDKTAGPRRLDAAFPDSCQADNNLIDSIGQIEKQVAGVSIDIAAHIQVTHNTIYQVPRAGINIGDGCFGGHLIAYNSVFKTVLETGDHGAFNSWGRDRFWNASRTYMDSLVALHPALILLDALKTSVIRNNLFRCDHGWDIDLDDGSSNYDIYNNLCLAGGIKFREGFYRRGHNNIILENSFHPHVWFKNSHDAFAHNIVMRAYQPIRIKDWGPQVDSNWFYTQSDLQAARANGTDQHSVYGDPKFKNPGKGDYRVTNQALLEKSGFQNFSMNEFGVLLPRLKAIALKPDYPDVSAAAPAGTGENKDISIYFQGLRLKDIQGLGEQSAYGLPDRAGVLVVAIEKRPQIKGDGTALSRAGLLPNDVIRNLNGAAVTDSRQFIAMIRPLLKAGKSIKIGIIRNQQKLDLQFQQLRK